MRHRSQSGRDQVGRRKSAVSLNCQAHKKGGFVCRRFMITRGPTLTSSRKPLSIAEWPLRHCNASEKVSGAYCSQVQTPFRCRCSSCPQIRDLRELPKYLIARRMWPPSLQARICATRIRGNSIDPPRCANPCAWGPHEPWEVGDTSCHLGPYLRCAHNARFVPHDGISQWKGRLGLGCCFRQSSTPPSDSAQDRKRIS